MGYVFWWFYSAIKLQRGRGVFINPMATKPFVEKKEETQQGSAVSGFIRKEKAGQALRWLKHMHTIKSSVAGNNNWTNEKKQRETDGL